MQSSHTTTDFTTGDHVHAALLRKLKTASAIITRSNLDSGEYVIYQGRPVPASVVAEFEAEAT